MQVKRYLLSFLLLPLVVTNTDTSKSYVENYVKSEVSGESAKVETNINTKVNETETSVKVNQPGEVEVKVKNEKVEIKTSKGITPTIIISGIPTQNIKIEEKVNQVNQIKPEEIISPIVNFIKEFFKKIFDFFRFSSP